MPKIKQIDEVVGAPVHAAAWCIPKGGAWAQAAGQVVGGLVGAAAVSALHKRPEETEAPGGNQIVAVTDTEVVTTTFSNVIGIKAKRVTARLPRSEITGADLVGKKIIKTLTIHLADGTSWAFDCRTVSHKDAARVVEALGYQPIS